MARKWKKIAAIRRKRITPPWSNIDRETPNADRFDKSSVVEKDNFVVYTMDKKRFVILLAHLKNSIFQELFKMSEEFRLSCNGLITLLWMKAMLSSITSHGCSSYTTNGHEGHAEKQSLSSVDERNFRPRWPQSHENCKKSSLLRTTRKRLSPWVSDMKVMRLIGFEQRQDTESFLLNQAKQDDQC
ncbi:hypothetical protein V6N11_027170 [Hibiscus sabdariffa]|uniref:Uncharacterized protein n=1 Tax=Hibiscus sabdariffa TaxID=183260 RepID=A0ABR2PG47_9ROSI